MFTFFLLFSSFICSVFALPLASRDIVNPPITSPTAGTVWHVGQTQTVTWNTTGLPVNQSNPVGMLVLGYLFNSSENLMLDSPLATHLNYSVGQAQITVPNVPTRSDYIIVLFGDSGNASPEFMIINDTSSTSAASPSPTSSPGSASQTLPAQSSTPPVNDSTSSPSGGSSPTTRTEPLTTAMTPASQTASRTNPSTTVVVQTTSPSPTRSSAAWKRHVPSLGTSLSVALVAIYFAFL